MSELIYHEWSKQQKLREDICNIAGHERRFKSGHSWYDCDVCQRCGRDKMANLNSANGDNWSASIVNNQVHLTYNGVVVYIEKGDVEMISMILGQMK